MDVAGSQFLCERFREGVHTALGSRIRDFHGGAGIAPYRGDIDDFSRVTFQHHGDGQATGIEQGVQIDIHDSLPFFHGHFVEQANVGDAGIIYQKSQILDLRKYPVYFPKVSHVGTDGGTYNRKGF